MTDLRDIATAIDAAATEPYLRARGWELVREGELGNRWRLRQDDQIRNVAVPRLDLDQEDKSRMLAAVLDVLVEVERRAPAVIARDLSEAPYDLVEFRLVAESLADGEIPLRAAPELTRGAFEAVQAAARAEIARRPHYGQGNLPSQVRTFVDETMLAGTARGSVILRVRAPAAEEPRQVHIEGLPRPDSFERRAVTRLLDGVRAAKTATHRDTAEPDADVFDEDIEDGLSANLCEALLKLSGVESGLGARVGLRVRWALTRPKDTPSSEVAVERGEIGQLDRVAKILKQIDPRPGTMVIGPVVQVRRLPDDQVGVVTINAEVDGRVRPVRMHLERSDYDIAVAAHVEEREIRATGTLERAGTTRELIETTHIETVHKQQP